MPVNSDMTEQRQTATGVADLQALLTHGLQTWKAHSQATYPVVVNQITGNDWDGSYPDICGGTITITWTVEDICETNTITATYTVKRHSLSFCQPCRAKPLMLVTSDMTEDTTDSTQAVADLEAAVDAWIANVESTFASGVSGGCEPK